MQCIGNETEMNTNMAMNFAPTADQDHVMVDIAAGQYRMTVAPASAELAPSSSEITYFSIQVPMPWTLDLATPP